MLSLCACLDRAVARPAPPPGTKPVASSRAAAPGWEIFSNANQVNALASHGGRLYAATSGGVAAWDLATGRLVRNPERDEIPLFAPVDERLIVELASRSTK